MNCESLLCIYVFTLCTCFVFPVSKRDQTNEATRLHFEHLVKRYGNSIIILNLIKVGGIYNACFCTIVFNLVQFLLISLHVKYLKHNGNL